MENWTDGTGRKNNPKVYEFAEIKYYDHPCFLVQFTDEKKKKRFQSWTWEKIQKGLAEFEKLHKKDMSEGKEDPDPLQEKPMRNSAAIDSFDSICGQYIINTKEGTPLFLYPRHIKEQILDEKHFLPSSLMGTFTYMFSKRELKTPKSTLYCVPQSLIQFTTMENGRI